MMFRKQWAAGVLLIGAVALAGCGGAAQPATPPAVVTNPISITRVAPSTSPLPTPAVADSPLAAPAATSLTELLAALQAAGATVETGNKVEQPFFEVQGTEIKVNGQTVQVFEWADETSRAAVSGTITPQGQFGTTQVEWVGTPRFWAAGKIIALYVGDDAQVIALLTNAMGAPIAQG